MKIFSENSIYGDTFGFLNDKALITIAYYLVDKYKNNSYRKILEYFHLFFDNQFVLKIYEEDEKYRKKNFKMSELLNIELIKEKFNQNKEWTILLPGYRKNNALQTLNKSTMQIIHSQSKIGF